MLVRVLTGVGALDMTVAVGVSRSVPVQEVTVSKRRLAVMTILTKTSHVRTWEYYNEISKHQHVAGISRDPYRSNRKRMANCHPFHRVSLIVYTCVSTNKTTTEPSEAITVTARELWSFRKRMTPPSVSNGTLNG